MDEKTEEEPQNGQTAVAEIVKELDRQRASARTNIVSSGVNEYEVRVRFTQLATTLNIRALDPTWLREPSLEQTSHAANRLIALLERDDVFDKPFRTLVRHSVALMYNALPHTGEAVAAIRSAQDAEKAALDAKALLAQSKKKDDVALSTAADNAVTHAEAERAAAIEAVKAQNPAGTTPAWKVWLAEALKSQDPRTAYNRACYHAARGETDAAIASLKIASRNPALKIAATTDVVLKKLADNTEFRKLVASSPRKDYWVLPPFAELKDAFGKVGVGDIRDLADATDPDIVSLAGALKLRPIELRRLIRLAKWVSAVDKASNTSQDADLAKLSVEFVDAMFAKGIETPVTLDRMWPKKPTLERDKGFGEFVAGIENKFGTELTLKHMNTWIDSLRSVQLPDVFGAPKAPPKPSSRSKR